MIRLVYATLLGLLGAGLVHLAIVFLLPLLSPATAWNTVATITQANDPVELDAALAADGLALARGLDPDFRVIVCRFDVGRGGVRVYSRGQAPLWTTSVHGTLGASRFSANDRIAAGGQLDIAVLGQRQLRLVRQNTPPALSNSMIVEADGTQGFVVVRVFVPDESWTPIVDDFIADLACDPLSF